MFDISRPPANQPVTDGGDKPMSVWWVRWLQSLADRVTFGITYGTGSPEGVVAAEPGRLYMDTAGGAGAVLYVKETGTAKTGWAAK